MSVPVTILGGYLGAGKTTFLNRLLSENRNRRIAVLVNDFGDINIDASLIENDNGSIVSLTNGCVCCSIGDDLGETLFNLLSTGIHPDHIVIEASGAADPAKVSGYTDGDPRLVLAHRITMADGLTIRKRRKDKFVGRLIQRQLQSADRVLISRGDLLDEAERDTLLNWMDAEIPQTPCTFTEGVDPILLLTETQEAKTDQTQSEELDFHPPHFGKASLPYCPEMDAQHFVDWMDHLPDTVQRAKGYVSLSGRLSGRFLFQYAGGKGNLTPAVDHDTDGLVLIATDSDQAALNLLQPLLHAPGGRSEP